MKYLLLTVIMIATVTTVVGQTGPRHRRPGGGGPVLTEAQRFEVRALTDSLRSVGASRTDIREAVDDLFATWGIVRPDHSDGMRPRLTEEQRTELRTLIDDMTLSGASRGEIKAAVSALFATWGLEPPRRGRGRHRGRIGDAGNRPNPFNPSTTIGYTVDEATVVSVQIYDIAGRLVKSYAPGYQNVGTHSVIWAGDYANGKAAPSGIYFYQIRAGEESLVQRMLLLK